MVEAGVFWELTTSESALIKGFNGALAVWVEGEGPYSCSWEVQPQRFVFCGVRPWVGVGKHSGFFCCGVLVTVITMYLWHVACQLFQYHSSCSHFLSCVSVSEWTDFFFFLISRKQNFYIKSSILRINDSVWVLAELLKEAWTVWMNCGDSEAAVVLTGSVLPRKRMCYIQPQFLSFYNSEYFFMCFSEWKLILCLPL